MKNICIWKEECEMDCVGCQFLSLEDEYELNLRERVDLYNEMIEEYSDGNMSFGG